MTTPPTPANWYPDPEDPTSLRYWDGWTWTEHRAPAPGAAADPTPAEPDPVPDRVQEQPVQPYDTHPAAASVPLGDDASWHPPLPSWDSLSTEPEKTDEPPAEEPPAVAEPSTAPAEPAAFAAAPFEPPPGPPPGYGPPPAPPRPTSHTKLIVGLAGAAVLVVVVAVAFVVMRTDKPTVTAGPSTSAATSTTSATPTTATSETAAAPPTGSLTPPPPGAEGTDGDYAFAVVGTETGDTITSTVSESVETAADGMYVVVHLNVTNTGTAPLTFVATFQQLNAAGQTFPLDDEATAFLGGTVAQIGPGEKAETPLVYDVPVGTQPGTIVLHADPSTPGVELPLS